MQNKYEAILADPAWSFRVWSKKGLGKSAENHYPTMNLEDICALPVADIAAADSALFLWATFPNLPEAFEVIKAWGFVYKTVAFTWVKRNKKSPFLCWLWLLDTGKCRIVSVGYKRTSEARVKKRPADNRRAHRTAQRKTCRTRTRIIELMGDLPRIELFERERVDGWDCWRNEVDSDITL